MEEVKEDIKELIGIIEFFWEDKSSKYALNNVMWRLSYMSRILRLYNKTLMVNEGDIENKILHLQQISIITKISIKKFSSLLTLPRKPKEKRDEFSKMKERAINIYTTLHIRLVKLYEKLGQETINILDKITETEMESWMSLFPKNKNAKETRKSEKKRKIDHSNK